MVRGTETILLVDDEETIIEVGQDILKALGYRVIAVTNGRSGIETYLQKKDEISLVLLDMVMPEMGGAETFEQLKNINPNIKVLLSSGYSIDGLAKKLLEKGCNGFIQKPFGLKELSQKIRDIIDKT
jgi:CheY-like chemotaxis protein